MVGIYKITNMINNKSYIGLSIKIERRWKEHIQNKSNSLIHQAISKYGSKNFKFEVLEECEEEMLATREEFWIKFYKSEYNLIEGGNRPPIHYGEKSPKAKLTDKQVDEIYILLKDTNLSYRDIAVQFGVWSSSIERIDKGLIRAKDDIDYPIRMNYHELLNKKAEQIIKLLKTSKLTQKEIAKKCKVSCSTVTMINIGKNHFNKDIDYPIRKSNNLKPQTQEETDAIISLLRDTTLSQKEIGRRFNLSVSTICDINKGRRRKQSNIEYPIRK